jgi:deoxyadenosine/deoxycytidine kinase
MGKIISVVGNLGAGKTSLTKLICDKGSFIPYWERPEERTFHTEYGKDVRRWALANQIDFFLFRCEQESIARQSDEIAVFDGGFDQDFHVFTQHIFNKNYLTQDEFDVCKRFYNLARDFLPPPDLVIRIIVDLPMLLQRRSSRGRITDNHLFSAQELTNFEMLLDHWFTNEISSPVLQFSFGRDYHTYTNEIEELIVQIRHSICVT